jgi:hypothetical protein
MRKLIGHSTVLFTALVLCPAATAGSFLNLHFEDATIPSDANWNGTDLPPEEAIPKWRTNDDTVHYGVSNVFIGLVLPPAIAIWDADEIETIEGKYSLFLQTPRSSIWQTADVPADSKSISLLEKKSGANFGSFQVRFNDIILPAVSTDLSNDLLMHRFDVSPFGGTTGKLEIVGSAVIDSIDFSTISIPERSTLVLCATGFCVAVSLGLSRKARRID